MIPQIQPWIDESELNELKRVIDSTYVTESNLTQEFETMTKTLTSAKHAIAICNGTAALFCALKALNIGPGDEVIVPDFTFIATANAVILAGAKPVFCEIDAKTFCMDVSQATVTPKTKALLPAHLYGQSADMESILEFAKIHNLFVIEDAAQGVGVKFKNKHVGTFGNIGILSYYGNKTITCGEGGVILTNDDELAKNSYRLKNHGRDTKGTFIHDHIGFNFSFTEMQAAVGISQMKKFDTIKKRKLEIHDIYINNLNNIEEFVPVFIDERTEPVYWFTSFLTNRLEELTHFLNSNGIQTRRFFYPLHLQPCYKDYNLDRTKFKISEDIFNKGISLPSSYNLTHNEQEKVISLIKKFFNK